MNVLSLYYGLSLLVFFLGLGGMFLKKNLLSILLCVELMLSGVSLLLILLSKSLNVLEAQSLVFFIIVVAACEGAIGISLILSLFKKNKTIESDDIVTM